jgi:hypothetical protein
MSGYSSQFFRYDCRTRGCYNEQLPCWNDLIDCFPRRIRPTDVDGMVEINDHFLFMEEKGPGVKLEEGQRLALRRLSTRPRVTTAFFRPGRRSDQEVLILGQGEALGWQSWSREHLRTWIRDWARTADESPPTRQDPAA